MGPSVSAAGHLRSRLFPRPHNRPVEGIMLTTGQATVAETEKVIGTDVSNVDPSKTYTDEFAQVADRKLGIR